MPEQRQYALTLVEAYTPQGQTPRVLFNHAGDIDTIVILKTASGRCKVVAYMGQVQTQAGYDRTLAPLEGQACRISRLTRDGLDNMWHATSAARCRWLIAARPPQETLGQPAELHLYLLPEEPPEPQGEQPHRQE